MPLVACCLLCLLPACASTQAATAAASAESGCPVAQISCIEDSATSVLLDVCGDKQLWMLTMNGDYEYAAPTEAKASDRLGAR